MALGPLSLSTTQGVEGRPFKAPIAGASAGSTIEVLSDSTPGFGVENGFVVSQSLPRDPTVVLREVLPGTGSRVSSITLTATSITALAAAAVAAIPGGRTLRGYRVGGVKQNDGSISYSVFAEDDLGATASAALGGSPTPTPTPTPTSSLAPLTLSYDGKQVFEASPAGTVIAALQGTTPGSTLTINAVQDSAGIVAPLALFAISGTNLVCGSTALSYATSQWYMVQVRETLAPFTPVDTWLYVGVLKLATPGTAFTDLMTGDGVLRSRTGWTGVAEGGTTANQDVIVTSGGILTFVSPGTSNTYVVYNDPGTANVEVKQKISGAMGASSLPTVYLRYQSRSTNNISFVVSAARNITIAKRVGGALTNLVNYDPGAGAPLVNGDEVAVRVLSGKLYLYVRGTLVGNTSGYDVSDVPTTSSKVAFNTANGATSTAYGIDELTITPLPAFAIDSMRQPVWYGDLASGMGYVSLSGTLPTSGGPASLKWRLEDSAGTLVSGYDWTNLSAIIDTATGVKTWRAFVRVPTGGNYRIKVGDAADTTTFVTSDLFGVGIIALGYGQSNMAHMAWAYASATDSTSGRAWQYNGATLTTAAGYPTAGLANTLYAALSRPVFVLNQAIGSQTMANLSPGAGTGYFEALRTAVIRYGGSLHMMMVDQGEAEASAGPDVVAWSNGWKNICDTVLAITGQAPASLPCFMAYTHGRTDTIVQGNSANGPGHITIRAAQKLWSTLSSRFYLSHAKFDCAYEPGDPIHHALSEQYSKLAPRFARSYLRWLGNSIPAQVGPVVSSITATDSTHTRLNINLNGADSIAADAGTLAGYQIVQGTTFTGKTPSDLLAISAITVGSNYIDLTHAAVTGSRCLRYPAATSAPPGGGTTVFDGAEMFGLAYTDAGGQAAAPQVKGSYASGAYTLPLSVLHEMAA